MASALLIIDMQQDFFLPASAPGAADKTVSRINAAISRARNAAMPIVFIQHEAATGIPQYATPGWALVQALDAQPGDYRIRKTTGDAFLRTELGELLRTLGISHVVVCGYATEFCVDTTVRRAAALGLDVTLVADAHTTHDKAHASAEQIRVHHNATLPAISSFGVKIQALPLDKVAFPA